MDRSSSTTMEALEVPEGARESIPSGKVFKYKLDFYYQQALMYVVTLIAYAWIRGSFIEDKFEFVFRDPIVYVILFFVLVSWFVLILNRIRDRKLIVAGDKLIFANRNRQRVVSVSDIAWIYIGREQKVQTSGRFQVIRMKLKNRRRVLRIRVGRYERDQDLVAEIGKLTEHVAKIRRSRLELRLIER
ncbi:MAG: hypothetical protein V3U68_05230 [Bacteroidota bacterium]